MKKIIILSFLLIMLLSVNVVNCFASSKYICDRYTCYQVINVVSNNSNNSDTTIGDIFTYISDGFKGFLNIPISNIFIVLFVFIAFIVFLFVAFLTMDDLPGLSLLLVFLSISSFFIFLL